MEKLIDRCDADAWPDFAALVELGLHHEQQHQELLLMDIKHVLSCNPLEPAYVDAPSRRAPPHGADAASSTYDGGLVEIGHDGATASRSTTSRRATRCTSSRSASPTGS